MLTAHSLLTPHRTRLNPPRAVLSELAVRKRWDSTVIARNHEIPGLATAGQLQAAAALPVRAIYHSLPAPFRAVSTRHSHSRDQPNSATMLPSNWIRQPQNTNERLIISTTTNTSGLFFSGSRSLVISFSCILCFTSLSKADLGFVYEWNRCLCSINQYSYLVCSWSKFDSWGKYISEETKNNNLHSPSHGKGSVIINYIQ